MMKKVWQKVIVHVDMDAFFASIEQLLNPEWRGKPVIVGADPKDGLGRGVVSAASYEARKYGVHSAMPISQAFRLCPHGIYAKPHGGVYKDYSRRIFSILNLFSPRMEAISIDEAFLDMTGNLHFYQDVDSIGHQIKVRIKQETSLIASIGIAPNKSLAKIASDFQKPDGLTIIFPDKVQKFLDPLPITKLWGIGQKTSGQLDKMGIRTVRELRQYPPDVIEKKFGKQGLHIIKMAKGQDDREVFPEDEAKSVSNEITFSKDCDDYEFIRNTIFSLSEKVGGRLRRSNSRGSTINIKIRFSNFKTYNRSHTLENSTNLTEEIFQAAEFMLSEFNPLDDAVRLVGVGVSNLMNEKPFQLSFWESDKEKKVKVEKVMDKIQDKYGKGIISHAESIGSKNLKNKDHD
jgi:nucleotidyltransferase/DNA polymerase involved in DNA repair